MREKLFWKVLRVFLALIIVFYMINIPSFADDSNGESGDGKINGAYTSWYQLNEWGWRVSVYVAKDINLTDAAYKESQLDSCYYHIGTINITNKDFVKSNALIGQKNKAEYINNSYIQLTIDSNTVVYKGCPGIPIVTPNATVAKVNEYFLQNTTILRVLQSISTEQGLSNKFDLVKNLEFTYHGTQSSGVSVTKTQTGAEWGENCIFPYDQRTNCVPWVIVYEPMICVYFQDGSAPVFLTATEYALTQGYDYNWHTVGTDSKITYTYGGVTYYTGKLKGRAVQSLAFKNLPASVSLEKKWFGYKPTNVATGSAWSTDDIIATGGWGMGFLSATADGKIDPEDYEPDPDPSPDPLENLSMRFVNTGGYRAGDTVVTSYIVENGSGYSIESSDRILTEFNVYSDSGKLVYSDSADYLIVPTDEETYVWFTWTVPSSGYNYLRVSARLATEGTELAEGAETSQRIKITKVEATHTPEQPYNATKPWYFDPTSLAKKADAKTTWCTWSYIDGEYVKNEYSASASLTVAITPDERIGYTLYKDNYLAIRSGYGVTIEANVNYDLESSGDFVVTDTESVTFHFSEYKWSSNKDEYEIGEKVDGKYVFAKNPDAKDARVHYVPIWYPDGIQNYAVKAVLEGVYTPGGKLAAVGVSNGISVDGDLFDDWKIVHY